MLQFLTPSLKLIPIKLLTPSQQNLLLLMMSPVSSTLLTTVDNSQFSIYWTYQGYLKSLITLLVFSYCAFSYHLVRTISWLDFQDITFIIFLLVTLYQPFNETLVPFVSPLVKVGFPVSQISSIFIYSHFLDDLTQFNIL